MEESKENEVSRRNFLKQTAKGMGGVLVLLIGSNEIASLLARADTPTEEKGSANEKYVPHKHQYVYLIDITKCIGCGACVRACELENDVPPHHFRTWVERYMVSRTGHIGEFNIVKHVDSPNGGRDGFEPITTGHEITKGFFVPKLCNHCTYTPCVQLCPVGASYRSPDGVILVDEKWCIGCSYCVQACPYGSRFIHPVTHIASKCTFCYHRITKGLLPACVQACPVGARRFGDKKKIGDEVSEIIATQAVHVIKPELLTEPNCYYMGMSQEVR